MTRNATPLRLAVAALTLAAWAGSALAQIAPEPVGGFAGYATHDYVTGRTTMAMSAPAVAPTVIYQNTTSAANFAYSSTDLAAIWGDELFTIDLGTLQEMSLAIYNSSSSVGPLLTATVEVHVYDGGTSTHLGGFSANFNFGTGLNAGFYAIGTISGLDVLAIDLSTTDLIVTQTITAHTGTANRFGIISFDPPTVGSSGADMYISATTVGPAGWYNITGYNANPGYAVTVVSSPVPTTKGTWGRLKDLYR